MPLSLSSSPVPDLWRAIQTHLKILADGEPGRQTATAVWRALGLPEPTPSAPNFTTRLPTPEMRLPTKSDEIAAVLGAQIIHEATRFVNLREVKPNQDWDNPATPGPDTALVQELRILMRASPWEPGWAYCAAFAEGIVALALQRLGLDPARFRAVMSPHCVSSWKAFSARGLVSSTPVPGAIWLLRHGNTTNGHAALVVSFEENDRIIHTIEGNTSKDAKAGDKDREGDWITTKTREWRGTGSLRTLGFITPAHVLSLL